MSGRELVEVVIIGGGPAGLSAAVWCRDLGLAAVVVERSADIGGQLHEIYGPIENYLGVRAENGEDMLEHFRRTLEASPFRSLQGREVLSIDLQSQNVDLDVGEKTGYRCLILATGVRRRRLGVPGEVEFLDRGVLRSGVRDRDLVGGKNVVIVGGGDAAIENALMLAEHAGHVTVVHRRGELSARDDFIRELDNRANVEILFESEVAGLFGDSRLSGVTVIHRGTRESRNLPADAALIRIGVEPNSDLVKDDLDLDNRGYIVVDGTCRTSQNGVFAIGDVANPVSPTISTAVGMGTTAAKAAYQLIKADENGL